MSFYRLEEIQARGKNWRNQFDDLLFVGQVPLDEAELDRLCLSVGRYPERTQQDKDFWAVVTVAVVNLAYYSVSDDHDAFRGFALKKLGSLKDRFWNDHLGPSIFRILKEYFGEEERSGPYRYVSPIMRQAGVPARSFNQFSTFFQRLTHRNGLRFSQAQFKNCLSSHSIQSNNLRSFLKSNVGWEFCRDAARILSQTDYISDFDNLSLPGFRRNLFDLLWQIVKGVPTTAKRSTLPKPKLALDLSRLQLVIEFDEKGLNGGYSWGDGKRVKCSHLFLEEKDFDSGLNFWIAQPNGGREEWEAKIWEPGNDTWAMFQLDGSFYRAKEDGRKIRPGRYILVLPEDREVPLTYERLGELYVPHRSDLNLKVIECELTPGFSISELDLFVDAYTTAAMPALKFGYNTSLSHYTNNVFVETLPRIEIVNWTREFSRYYRITYEIDNQIRYVPDTLYSDQNTFQLKLTGPSQGRIGIEPRGWTPKGFTGASLQFTLLPEGKFDLPVGLFESEDCITISLNPADRFEIIWSTSEIKMIDRGNWLVPSHTDFIEGRVTYQNMVSFSIYVAINRLKITSEAIDKNILWRDSFKRRSQIEIALSREEIGKRVEVGIMNGRFECATMFGPISGNGMLRIFTDDIRDAFRDQHAGYVAVRLPSSRIVRSEIAFLNDELIAKRIQDEAEDQDWLKYADEDLRGVVDSIRQGRVKRPESQGALVLLVPPKLKNVLLHQEICRQIFDSDAGEEALRELPEGGLRKVLGWYIEAGEFIKENKANLVRAAELLQQAPTSLKSLSFKRWRDSVSDRESMLRSLLEFFNSIKRWSDLCRNGNWRTAKKSAIGKMDGGQSLTDGAASYFTALEEKHVQRPDYDHTFNCLEMARKQFLEAKNEAREGLIYELAWALEAMSLYHYGDSEGFRLQADSIISSFGRHWQRLKISYQRLMEREVTQEEARESLGLSQISPHSTDLQLEETLNGR